MSNVVQAADILSGMGLGMVADQLKELKLGELLETPPPGLDEAVAIAKVVQFVNSQVRRDTTGRDSCACSSSSCRVRGVRDRLLFTASCGLTKQ
jgi:hypothetical protein